MSLLRQKIRVMDYSSHSSLGQIERKVKISVRIKSEGCEHGWGCPAKVTA